jgi:two-component system chemotaxis response regulator CheY
LCDNKKVLVVCKPDVERIDLQNQLQEMGFKNANVKGTPTGENAWDLLHQEGFNLIVLVLEEVDGAPDLELLTSVKEDNWLKKIPFVVIGPEKCKAQVQTAGVSQFICKPLDKEDFKMAVQRAIIEVLCILVVDDSEFFREVLKEILSELKFKKILEGSDGLEGLEAMKTAGENGVDIDLVISDWEMPRMDGLGLLKAIKDNPKTEHIPFIILTAHPDKKRVMSAIQSGATDYVVKPDLESLGEKIDKIFDIQI